MLAEHLICYNFNYLANFFFKFQPYIQFLLLVLLCYLFVFSSVICVVITLRWFVIDFCAVKQSL
jgi:hypothetical protein